MHEVEIHERHQDRSGKQWTTDIKGNEMFVTFHQKCGRLDSAVTIDVDKLLELNRQLKIVYQPATGQFVQLTSQLDEVTAHIRDNMNLLYELLDDEELPPIVRTVVSYALATIITGDQTDGTR